MDSRNKDGVRTGYCMSKPNMTNVLIAMQI